MTILYVKTNEENDKFGKVQLQYHSQRDGKMSISMIASSYDDSSNEKLFEITSNTYSEEEILSKISKWCTKLNIIDAQILGETLQPARRIEQSTFNDPIETTEYIDFKFELISFDDAVIESYKLIDNKTFGKFNYGFEYDNETFSLSNNAQKNWTSFRLLFDNGDIPNTSDVHIVPTLENGQYNLKNYNIPEFTNVAWNKIQNIVSQGLAVKESIKGCSTFDELKSIIDSYI